MVKFFKQMKEPNAKPFEITADEAWSTLSGWWKHEYLDDIIDNGKSFRLYTPFSEVWTETDGLIPQAGFYGIVGE